MRNLKISKNLPINSSQRNLVAQFCKFCASNLSIRDPYQVYVIDNRDAHDIQTTAAYHIGKNKVKVYGKNRALVDIMRSIAHEMTHMMQDEQGMITGPVQDAGGFHEDQANAKAGELIKLYAKSHPQRKRIYEAKRIPSSTCLW